MIMNISRCRYFWCSKCNSAYKKEEDLKNWEAALFLPDAQFVIGGTLTCHCGNVFIVQDIYEGKHDLPRQYWNQVEPPVEV
jgi:hypothetical protein